MFLILFHSLSAQAKSDCLAQAPSLKSVLDVQIEAKQFGTGYLALLCKDLESDFDAIAASDVSTRATFEKFDAVLNAQPKPIKTAYLKKLDDIKKLSTLPERLAAAYDLSAEAYGQFDLESSRKLWTNVHLDTRAQQRSAVLAMTLARAKRTSSEFGLKLITFHPFKDPRSLVRISFPSKKLVFDLDPARAGRTFAALPAHHSAKVSKDECMSVFRCEVNDGSH